MTDSQLKIRIHIDDSMSEHFIKTWFELIALKERKWIEISFRIPSPKHFINQCIITLKKHSKIIIIIIGKMNHRNNGLSMLPDKHFFKNFFQFFIHKSPKDKQPLR